MKTTSVKMNERWKQAASGVCEQKIETSQRMGQTEVKVNGSQQDKDLGQNHELSATKH